MASSLDPITLEVLTQALIATVREMRATVCRTASSVAIYDAKDFSCGLFAPDSQVIAQSEDIGSHVVPMPWSVRAAMEKMGAALAEGDVILANDPYAGGFVTQHYGKPLDFTHALQIEINRALYMDEESIRPSPTMPRLASDMDKVIAALGAIERSAFLP